MSRLVRLLEGVRLSSAVILLFILVLCWGCGEPARQVGEGAPVEIKKAMLLRQIERKFENPEAHFELGRLYQADGLWEKAEYEYNIVLGFVPNQRDVQAALVKLLLERGDATKSALYADIYMNQAGSSAQSSLVLGRAFQEQGLDEYAYACYEQALRLAPNSAGIHKQIGYYYLSKNDQVRALEYLKRSFQLDPYQPEVAGELGRMGVVVKIPRKKGIDTDKLDEVLQKTE
jgi:tetratricopeptide (TPR) repeat protein